MSAPETKIKNAFEARLKTFPTLPVHPHGLAVNIFFTESVAWEDMGFTPDPATPYLKPFLVPGEPFQAEQGEAGYNWHTGIYQISVYAPSGKGPAVIDTLKDALVAYFKRGTTMVHDDVSVQVTKAWPAGAMPDGGWTHIPITIRYRVFASN
jgi:hypothetical protein